MVTVVNPYPVIVNPSTQQTGTANLSGQIQGSVFKAGGLTGSTGVSRYVGGTASGAPASGTFSIGDFIIDRTGTIYICTTAGSPGTWTQVVGNASLSGEVSATDFKASGLTGATQASRYVGATASGAPVSGTFVIGDYIIDRTGTIYICTVAGTPGTWTQASGAARLTASNLLNIDVTLTNANTYYDGPTISLAAGTWFISGNATCYYAAGAAFFTAKIWDGTTVASSAETTSGNTLKIALSLSAIVSPSITTTYKLSIASNAAGAFILKAANENSAGDNATNLFAIQVA